MNSLELLLTPAEVRKAENRVFTELGIPTLLLMEHAALAVTEKLAQRFGRTLSKTSGLILVGPGNNGADGMAVARLLHSKGVKAIRIAVLPEGKVNKPKGELWQFQYGLCEKLGIPTSFDEPSWEQDWVVDALYGSGFQGPLGEVAGRWLSQANQAQSFRLAVDIPSGLNGETGVASPQTFQAHETVTFAYAKTGLATCDGPEHTGRLNVAFIQIPRSFAEVSRSRFLFRPWSEIWPKRSSNTHKGTFGSVRVIAGIPQMEGATVLSALAALRMGSGLARVVAPKAQWNELRIKLPPEVLLTDQLMESTDSAIVIGPGLGRDPSQWSLLESLLQSSIALVIDADAIHLLSDNATAAKSLLEKRGQQGTNTILTPHPKEASSLLGCDTDHVQANRYAACEHIAQEWTSTVVLKGSGTVIADRERTVVNGTGNAALAKGGTGDVLSGIIASWMGQGVPPFLAAALGCYLHGKAAEMLCQHGHTHSVLASEIADILPSVLNAAMMETQ